MSVEMITAHDVDGQHDEGAVFFDADEQDDAATIDGIGTYLNRIGRIARLKADEEIALAKDIEAGRTAERLLAEEVSRTAAETRALRRTMELGRRAAETMVTANLRLVMPVATRYRGKGVPFADLIQEGNLAIIDAAQKFDHTRGFKFSTYATGKIYERIIHSFFDQGRKNPLKRKDGEQVSKLSRIQRELAVELMRDPTVEELAQAMELPVEKTIDLLYINREPLSLDARMGDAENVTLLDVIADKRAEEAGTAVPESIREAVDDELSKLTERQETVVRGIFGLDESGIAKTYAELADELGVKEVSVSALYRKSMRDLQKQALETLN